MYLYPSAAEGLAWLKSSADELARFVDGDGAADARTFAAAAERRADEPPAAESRPAS